MKIIKPGRLDKKAGDYIAICSACGCEFQFSLDEVTGVEKKIDGGLLVECPFCHSMQWYFRSELKVVSTDTNETETPKLNDEEVPQFEFTNVISSENNCASCIYGTLPEDECNPCSVCRFNKAK